MRLIKRNNLQMVPKTLQIPIKRKHLQMILPALQISILVLVPAIFALKTMSKLLHAKLLILREHNTTIYVPTV